MKVNFQEAIYNAISSKFTGRLVFMGPEGGVVRVVFVEGKIKEVDSTWGYGSKELEKLEIWKEGSVITKELTQKEIEKYKASPTIEYKFVCPNCKNEIPINTNFCPECGYQVRNVKVCLNCGFENPPNAKFCEKCGNKFYTEQITKNVKTCPNCSSAIHQNAKFCPECGYNFVKICPRCKAENPADAKFCEECGYLFKQEKKSAFSKLVFILPIFLILIIGTFLAYALVFNKTNNKNVEILHAPNVIQEFLTFKSDTTKEQISKVETIKTTPQKPQKIQKIQEEKKNLKEEVKGEKKEEIVEVKKEEKLNCEENNYTYRNLKIDGISFEINEDKNLPKYKYGPIKLNSYDTLKANLEVISGLLRSKEAILLAINSLDLSYIENSKFYKTDNINNFESFVKSGFNLPFKKVYITSRGTFIFNPHTAGEYYLVVINPPFIEKKDNKIYIKTRPLFFNLQIILKTCKFAT
ncbi:MAG: zinc ribbon domain-containing protein [candidate division WOR-3 bacterium]